MFATAKTKPTSSKDNHKRKELLKQKSSEILNSSGCEETDDIREGSTQGPANSGQESSIQFHSENANRKLTNNFQKSQLNIAWKRPLCPTVRLSSLRLKGFGLVFLVVMPVAFVGLVWYDESEKLRGVSRELVDAIIDQAIATAIERLVKKHKNGYTVPDFAHQGRKQFHIEAFHLRNVLVIKRKTSVDLNKRNLTASVNLVWQQIEFEGTYKEFHGIWDAPLVCRMENFEFTITLSIPTKNRNRFQLLAIKIPAHGRPQCEALPEPVTKTEKLSQKVMVLYIREFIGFEFKNFLNASLSSPSARPNANVEII